jgi:hypothetical protein
MDWEEGEVNNVSGHAATDQVSEAGRRVCFTRLSWGVSQEEVQKKPQPGTTQ